MLLAEVLLVQPARVRRRNHLRHRSTHLLWRQRRRTPRIPWQVARLRRLHVSVVVPRRPLAVGAGGAGAGCGRNGRLRHAPSTACSADARARGGAGRLSRRRGRADASHGPEISAWRWRAMRGRRRLRLEERRELAAREDARARRAPALRRSRPLALLTQTRLPKALRTLPIAVASAELRGGERRGGHNLLARRALDQVRRCEPGLLLYGGGNGGGRRVQVGQHPLLSHRYIQGGGTCSPTEQRGIIS